MDDEKYRSTKTDRFYPGRISEERARQLLNFEVAVEDITVDDIIYMLSRSWTTTIYVFLGMIRERWGEEAARESAEQYGYLLGQTAMRRWLRRLQTDTQTPETMCMYQDLQHALGGPNFAENVTEYDDEKVVIRRTKCVFHTNRPRGMESYCEPIIDGYVRAYLELDKGLEGGERVACMCRGDDYCLNILKYRKRDR